MNQETFYHDHWVSIEEERLARYEEMFVFRPQQDALLKPLQLEPNLTVIDYGCGPGFMAAEIASRVSAGHVYGLDINDEFITRATERNRDTKNLSFRPLPIAENDLKAGIADRLICKNVLEYVPDLTATLREQYDLLKPGGRILLIDSDWDFVIVEPWGPETTRTFFKAASPAFNEPNIGRKLYGELTALGFSDVNVQISAMVDVVGAAKHVLTNMRSYIAEFDTMPGAEIDALFSQLDDAVENRQFMFILPQFLVTGVK